MLVNHGKLVKFVESLVDLEVENEVERWRTDLMAQDKWSESHRRYLLEVAHVSRGARGVLDGR